MKKNILLLIILLIPTVVFSQSIDQGNNSLDSAFSNPTDLTDKEMNDAQNFTHQGIKDRKIKEGCEKLNNCSADENGFPLEQMIGKAYALMGMLTNSGGGMMPTLTKADKKDSTPQVETPAPQGDNAAAPQGANGAQANQEKETQADYCMMTAMAWETVGGFIQQSLQSKAENAGSEIQDIQLKSLVNLKETHKARAKTASWQRNIYGAVTLCYAGLLVTGQVKPDWKYMLKVSGSTALTVLYQRKISKHKKAAEDVQKVIDSLPKVGDCNPWTGTACFCNEKTSKDIYPGEYQEICILNNGNFETPKIALGCGSVVNNKVQYDKECKCKQTNSCLKSNLQAYNPKFPLGANLMNEANKNFNLLNDGNFDQGQLDVAASGAAALAAKVKAKPTDKIPVPNLTADQKKMADALSDVLPPAAAAFAAASDSAYKGGINESGMGSSSVGKLSPEVKEKLASTFKARYKRGGGNTVYSPEEPAFVMPNFGQQAKDQNSGTEIISFAEQAVSKADVTNAPETPIFDIISNRYQRSGWKKLETLEK